MPTSKLTEADDATTLPPSIHPDRPARISGQRAIPAPAVVDTATAAAPSSSSRRSWDLRSPLVGANERAERGWNTDRLAQRIAVDGACAATAGGLVAPLISMIDRAIIENASGRQTMLTSFRGSLNTLLFRPHRFIASRPFRLIFLLYSGTYLTANSLDTVKSTLNASPASSTTSGAAKFAATSVANLSLCLYKDSQFTKMFGTSSPRPIPGASYALFAARDSLTIFASFNLPPLLAPVLPLSGEVDKYISRASAAQFIAPAAVQLVSTPMHLLGLDLYNREAGRVGWSERLRKVRVDWLKSTVARMGRIIPAFGVGGVVNNGLRKKLMAGLEQ